VYRSSEPTEHFAGNTNLISKIDADWIGSLSDADLDRGTNNHEILNGDKDTRGDRILTRKFYLEAFCCSGHQEACKCNEQIRPVRGKNSPPAFGLL
jgi:hypothetical protein